MAATRSRNPPLSKQLRDRGSGPQGLRRPRFSFFLFTCQTARDQAVPFRVSRKTVETPCLRPTIGSLVTIISVELRGRTLAPSSGRCAVQPVYRLSGPLVSTLAAAKKYRPHPRVRCKIYRICSRAHQPHGGWEWPADAPLGPHSSAVLTGKAGGVSSGELYVGITIRDGRHSPDKRRKVRLAGPATDRSDLGIVLGSNEPVGGVLTPLCVVAATYSRVADGRGDGRIRKLIERESARLDEHTKASKAMYERARQTLAGGVASSYQVRAVFARTSTLTS